MDRYDDKSSTHIPMKSALRLPVTVAIFSVAFSVDYKKGEHRLVKVKDIVFNIILLYKADLPVVLF